MKTIKDKEIAYQETARHVSLFIDKPTHATGAAIDMTLFQIKDGHELLMDMGKFDVIYEPNDPQDTFSEKLSSLNVKIVCFC